MVKDIEVEIVRYNEAFACHITTTTDYPEYEKADVNWKVVGDGFTSLVHTGHMQATITSPHLQGVYVQIYIGLEMIQSDYFLIGPATFNPIVNTGRVYPL